MARIPEAELEALKSQVDLVALVRAHGVELKKHGYRSLVGHCPFHDDRTPSLVVTPAKNLWNCLGACQTGGSVVDWVMKTRGVSFRHAVELLRSGNAQAVLPAKDGTHPVHSSVRKLESPIHLDADDQTLLGQVVEYYHQTLCEAPEGLSYLAARGIGSREAVEHFKLGFSNRTLGLRIPIKQHHTGEQIRVRLQKLGVLRDTGHEHFNGSVVFPIFGSDGSVTGVYGRKITTGLKGGAATHHTYLPGPHRGVWNEAGVKSEAQKSGGGVLILCEAIIDALTFWVNGYKNVTAAYGVNGFTDEHLKLILDTGIRRVLIAYDRDEAGERAAEKLAQKLQGEGVECRRVQFPKGMDANSYACKVKPPAQALKVCLDGAVPYPSSSLKSPAPAADAPAEAVVAPASPAPEPLPSLVAVPDPVAVAPSVAENRQPAPRVSPVDVPAEIEGEDIHVRLGEREYRVRGLWKNPSRETMKVNLRASVELRSHVDTLDLYQAKARAAFVTGASAELGVGTEVMKRDLGRLLWKCEELYEKAPGSPAKAAAPEMTVDEEAEARRFLCRPDLLEQCLLDLDRCGVVGEETNKLIAYLAAVSRKLEDPLAIVVQSTSAAGKSSLMEAVLALVPPEDRVKYSAMTGQSLFYMGEKDLKHRVLAIAEEGGARQAAYALKLLQSEGELSIASTGKDPHTGKLVTQEYRVEGPVALFLTTTATDVDEELMNRCLVLTVDEERGQTALIHERQRRGQTLEGLLARSGRDAVVKKHQNAQRLIRPLQVVNPLASSLTFLDTHTRTRRDHRKYLGLIRAIALLHQYQRVIQFVDHPGGRIEYIEVEKRDIEIADRLFASIFARLLDELPPQARRLITVLHTRVAEESRLQGVGQAEYRFTRRQVREWLGWSDFQAQTHLNRLVRNESVAIHRGGRGSLYVYELLDPPECRDASSTLRTASSGVRAPSEGSEKKPQAPEVAREAGKVRDLEGGTTRGVSPLRGRIVVQGSRTAGAKGRG